MIYISIVMVVILGVIIYAYVTTKARRKQQTVVKLRREREYQRVLAEAKKVELKEKIFKAQTGHVPTQLSLAKEYELTNKNEAIKWYLSAAQQENNIAQYSLLRLYDSVPDNQDYKQKATYWRNYIKAKEGDPESKYQLGMLILNGVGVDLDVSVGIQFIEDAAKDDYIEAQLMMADWVVSETSGLNDYKRRFYWHMKAAILGNRQAQINVANAYKTGVGIDVSLIKACYWYERAATQNDAQAQLCAGDTCVALMDDEHNLNEVHDLNRAAVAYIWYSLAYKNGIIEAKKPGEKMATAIGLGSIVSVQSIAKKVLELSKTQSGQESIWMLDRLYNRKSYQPEKDEVVISIINNQFLEDYVA